MSMTIAAEAFYVLEGESLIFRHEEEWLCPAGSFIYIPAGVEPRFRVGRVSSRKLNIYLPAAMVGYSEELAAANEAGTALDADSLTRLAARLAVRVLGPVSGGYL